MSEQKNSTIDLNYIMMEACNMCRSVIKIKDYLHHITAILLLKHLSDMWKNWLLENNIKDSDYLELIIKKNLSIHYVITKNADFDYLYTRRNEPGNADRVINALTDLSKKNKNSFTISSDNVFAETISCLTRCSIEDNTDNLIRKLLVLFNQEDLNFISKNNKDTFRPIRSAYERLLKLLLPESQEGGSYTPSEIAELIVELLDPKPNELIYDPCCGSGGFLMQCGSYIQNKYTDNHYALYGQDLHNSALSIAKINSCLNDEHNLYLEQGDTITRPKFIESNDNVMSFDVVLAQPPLLISEWGYNEIQQDQFNRFDRGIPPKSRGEYAFILHMIASMKEHSGRMGIIVPHGVLFRGLSEETIRKQLIEENLLDAVIGLPERIFLGSNIATALLIFKKSKIDKNILFIDAKNEFRIGKNINSLSEEGISKIITAYKSRSNIEKFSHLADITEIIQNNYNLNISRYINCIESDVTDLKNLLTEQKGLQFTLTELDKEISSILEKLGYEH